MEKIIKYINLEIEWLEIGGRLHNSLFNSITEASQEKGYHEGMLEGYSKELHFLKRLLEMLKEEK